MGNQDAAQMFDIYVPPPPPTRGKHQYIYIDFVVAFGLSQTLCTRLSQNYSSKYDNTGSVYNLG